MSALAILTELSDRGIQVQPKGENTVFVSPKDKVTPDLIERIRAEKPTLIPALERIRYRAGDDWHEVAADSRLLKAFCELLLIEDMRRQVKGCPWCFNRHAGLPIPKVNGNG
jgi:hypothetical protein